MTGGIQLRQVSRTNFNSHAHVERDLVLWPQEACNVIISTHTLTWSVTYVPFLYIPTL